MDSSLLGSKRHLVKDDQDFTWVDVHPTEHWIISGKLKSEGLCLDTLLALEDITLDLQLEKRFQRMIKTVMSGSVNAPLHLMLPRETYANFIRKLVDQVDGVLDSIPKDYYVNTWMTGTRLLSTLTPARVDFNAWQDAMTRDAGNKHVIQTFKPGLGDIIDSVTYDRFGTRTGRLTVASGPRILTLKREARSIIKSSFKGGSIMTYDFSALEPRIVMYEAGLRQPSLDIYETLRQDLFDDNVSRSMVKGVLIAEIYGRSNANLAADLGMSLGQISPIVNKIRERLRMTTLQKNIKDEYVKRGYIRNHYGRRVAINEPLDHIIFNSYIQSTGVDVTMHGFMWLVDNVLRPQGCLPLFLLHDAIVFDVPPGIDLQTSMWVKVPGYVQPFPLKLEKLS